MLIIYGPTAVGKTELANELAQQMSAEIINMDVGQFYAPLTIGTAKPDWRNAKVPHHLFDIIDEPRNCTVAEYRTLVSETLEKVWGNKALPILVGGSGFYLKSLFFPPLVQVRVKRDYPTDVDLWQLLYDIDPERAAEIDRHDIYRIKRALDIWYATGEKPSAYQPQYDPLAPAIIINVTRERQELRKRIDTRVIEMIEAGWVDEVAQLQETEWKAFIQEKKIIGYNELFEYLAAKKTAKKLEQVVRKIQARTRQYAKRQITFWRMLERALRQAAQSVDTPVTVESVNLTSIDLHLYIKQLQEILPKMVKRV